MQGVKVGQEERGQSSRGRRLLQRPGEQNRKEVGLLEVSGARALESSGRSDRLPSFSADPGKTASPPAQRGGRQPCLGMQGTGIREQALSACPPHWPLEEAARAPGTLRKGSRGDLGQNQKAALGGHLLVGAAARSMDILTLTLTGCEQGTGLSEPQFPYLYLSHRAGVRIARVRTPPVLRTMPLHVARAQ